MLVFMLTRQAVTLLDLVYAVLEHIVAVSKSGWEFYAFKYSAVLAI